MLGISWYEYLLIAVVALIVIGPKELPAVLRTLGQWTTKVQRMAAEFRGQFQEAMREAEMADLKKEVDNISDHARSFTSQFNDPVNFNDAMKWEPKTAEINKAAESSSTAENTAEIDKLDNVVAKPSEDSPAHVVPEPVTSVSDAAAAGPASAAEPLGPQTAVAPESVPSEPTPPTAASKAEEGVHS
jgi:sec-independent protein translocase protein TatB